MFRRLLGLTAILLLLAASALPAAGFYRPSDGAAATTADDYAFVRFNDPPLASYGGNLQGYAATRPSKGQKLDLNSPAAKKYGQRLASQRDNYIKWLQRQYPQVQIVTEYSVVYNGLGLKLNGATLKEIGGGPGAAETGVSGSYRRAMNTSHGIIDSAALWNALGGQDGAGAGVMVGIIDSGIDERHPFLNDAGMTAPAGFPKGDTHFTSNKVIVAKAFHQNPWLSAKAVESHGTHVSGTVAGRAGTTAPMASGLSGVAPGAWLGNYNVFPGTVEDAKSLFIAKAVEEAVADGMDVLNLSLGGTPHQGKDLLDMAVDAATDAGVVVAIAAGNEGPGHYTVGSPGTASKVITAAAITNSHRFAMFLNSPALPAPTDATTGTGGGELTGVMSGSYGVWSEVAGGDKLACTPISGQPLAGKLALIQRGACNFSVKINNAAAAGATGVIIYNRDDENEPISMSTDGALIPAVMVSRDAGYLLRAADAADRTAHVAAPPVETPATPGLVASFTSWGPTPNYTLKPDVAAPGVGIYSSVVGGNFEVYQGTSMATPHVAGAAALLIAHSRANGLGWGPQEIKSALMGTAAPGADSNDPLKVGAGIIDLARAMNPPALANPASLSFGLIRPVGNHTYSMTFTLTNSTQSAQTYTLSGTAGVSVTPASLTLAAGQSTEITATVVEQAPHTPGQGDYPKLMRGFVSISSGAGDIGVPYLYVLDYNR